VVYQVNGSRVEWNPSPARLRELTEEMPNASVTEFGNVNVKARVDSRSTRSTYLVDDSTNSRGQTITRSEYDRVAALQDAHIARSRMVVVDGYIGSDPQFPAKARLIMEAANANEYAAMVARLKRERPEFPGSFPGLDESLVKSPG
jgi:phosphoenolpyruvate carboxykinase (ATP)